MADEPVADVHAPGGPTSIQGDDTFSLLNFVTEKLRDGIMSIPQAILDMDEKDLKRSVQPTGVDYSLRVSFWREFDKCMWNGTGKITSISVYAGICSDSYWYNKFLRNSRKMAWLVRPLQGYQKEMESILHRGTERLWELMETPLKVNGKFSARNAEIVLKTVKQVEDRVKGMAVQRKETKTLRVNVNGNGKAIESGEAMEARIRQLEAELGEAPMAVAQPVVEKTAALPAAPLLPAALHGDLPRESIALSAARVVEGVRSDDA